MRGRAANGEAAQRRPRGPAGDVDDYDGSTYRAVYTGKLAGRIYVLHVFQKKSTRGIATPKYELEVIRMRLRWVRAYHAQHPPNEV